MKKQAILTITILGLLAGAAHSLDARRNNHRRNNNHTDRNTAVGILAGAGTGGVIAGVAGSAKWVPLGIVGGAIGGYFLIKALRSNYNNRSARTNPTQTTEQRHVRQTYQQNHESNPVDVKKENSY